MYGMQSKLQYRGCQYDSCSTERYLNLKRLPAWEKHYACKMKAQSCDAAAAPCSCNHYRVAHRYKQIGKVDSSILRCLVAWYRRMP